MLVIDNPSSTYRQGSFVRIFAGQIILVVALMVVAALLYAWAKISVVFLFILALATVVVLSTIGPAYRLAQEVTVDSTGLRAQTYLGGLWSSQWDDLACALVLDVPTFGARRRLKIVSHSAGALFVSEVIENFDQLIADINTSAPHLQPCAPPRAMERWRIGG